MFVILAFDTLIMPFFIGTPKKGILETKFRIEGSGWEKKRMILWVGTTTSSKQKSFGWLYGVWTCAAYGQAESLLQSKSMFCILKQSNNSMEEVYVIYMH